MLSNYVAMQVGVGHSGYVTESTESDEIPRFDGRGALARAAELLADFEANSVMTLLYSACSSPTARQATAACSALLMSCWIDPPAGQRVARCEDLAPLVEALRLDCPDFATVEDFLPLDPRNCVKFRAKSENGSWDFRVHPGGLESPLRVLQAVVNYAEAIDPVLLPRFGFGVADMLDLAGLMLDQELSVLAPAWGDQQVSQESVPTVTDTEMAAAGEYLLRWRSGEVLTVDSFAVQGDQDGGRRGRTARSLTIDCQHLTFDAGLDRVYVGPALLVHCTAGVLPVPSALIIESLVAAVTTALRFLSPQGAAQPDGLEHSESASGLSADVPRVTDAEAAEAERRWRGRANSDLAWACRAIPATILFGYQAEDGHELLLIGAGHRHVVAVDLVTGLSPQEITTGIHEARERLVAFGPGSGFRVSPQSDGGARLGHVPDGNEPPTGTTDSRLAWVAGTADAIPFAESLMAGDAAALVAGTVVTRVVVVDGPWQHEPRWLPEIPACTLDEFRSLLAAQDWQSTDREELWAFLDELASLGADGVGSGYAQIVCWSVLDAWEAWQIKGMLTPAWVHPDTCAYIPPRDLEYAWERDALLDDVDALLASFGMGGAREWSELIPTSVPVARADSDKLSLVVTLSLYKPRRIWRVAVDMGLLVMSDLEFRHDLTFSRAALDTLANAVEDTLREVARRSPEAWQFWRKAHGDHPVAIQITPGHLPEDMPAVRFIGMGMFSDQIYADPRRLTSLAPADVHALIGEALSFGMLARLQPIRDRDESAASPDQADSSMNERTAPAGQSSGDVGSGWVMELSPSPEDIQHAEVFRTAWQSIQPRFAQRANRTPFAPYSLTRAQTLTESGRNRARRMIARRLKGQLSPGVHPLRVVLSDLCPGALDALSDTASGYACRAALAAACAELERALSDRLASRMGLELSLGSSWADEVLTELDVGASSEETERSRVAELLIESLLSHPPDGPLVPDRRDVHQLLDLASAALDASLEAQYAFAAIRPAALEVSEFGDIDIVPDGPDRVDIRGWQQARLEDQARVFTASSGSPDHADIPSADRSDDSSGKGVNQRETLRSALEGDLLSSSGFQALNAGGLLTVDDQLIEYSGFGLDSVLAVLATVTNWEVPAEPHPPIAQVTRAALVDDVTAWSGLPRDQIDAAVGACTLTTEHIRREGLRYWQLRERSARLALRPLIEPPDAESDGELWLLPRCAHRTQHLLLTYLNDQQLPWPGRDLPRPVRHGVKAWHKLAEDRLESELATIARTVSLACRPNLTEQKAMLEGLVIPGEIDLIAADLVRQRIWVMEAKHLRQIFGPLEIGFRLADFHGAGALAIGPDTNAFRQFQGRTFKPYVQRVVSKAEAVQHNKQAAIRLINAVSTEANFGEGVADNWEVIPLIVVSHVEVSAFVPDPEVLFVQIDYLQELLMTDALPPSGWWSPWAHRSPADQSPMPRSD